MGNMHATKLGAKIQSWQSQQFSISHMDSLQNMPYEHDNQAIAIAKSLGEVIGMDTTNENAKDPRFCINWEICKGWVVCIELESEGVSQPLLAPLDHLANFHFLAKVTSC